MTEERRRDLRVWKVAGNAFAWERPLGKGDRAALGDAAPDGGVLAARVPDVSARAALVAEDPSVFFTIPHFDGFAAVLMRLEPLSVATAERVLVEAFIDRAPRRVAAGFFAPGEPPEPPDLLSPLPSRPRRGGARGAPRRS